jgi:hypothetical protein
MNNVTSYEDFQFKILAHKQRDVIWRNAIFLRRMHLFVNNMADPENVKSCMSYVQQYTKIIKIPTLKTYFG